MSVFGGGSEDFLCSELRLRDVVIKLMEVVP